MQKIDDKWLEEVFKAERYVKLRNAAKEFARVIVECSPAGPDQTTAIRKVREAVMTANQAIALEQPESPPKPVTAVEEALSDAEYFRKHRDFRPEPKPEEEKQPA